MICSSELTFAGMRVKICGITTLDQGRAIAQLGATDLGFICVRQSPRYVTPQQIRAIAQDLSQNSTAPVGRVGVFADASVEEIGKIVAIAQLTAVQLHGQETPQFCQALRQALPSTELIKAFRVKTIDSLHQTQRYFSSVHTLLLDAYDPNRLGGTGHTLDWTGLKQFSPPIPWLLAGGLNPDNVATALRLAHPQGIDLSSGVERSPGIKDLDQVARLFAQLKAVSP
ncbi:MAG: phosphoribosylanthranilate isomerase [Synechococcales bacterium]|nr:phosphoribosylanthranilate isomerase [Synechococcales bacterium]